MSVMARKPAEWLKWLDDADRERLALAKAARDASRDSYNATFSQLKRRAIARKRRSEEKAARDAGSKKDG